MLISIDQSYSGTGICYMSEDGRIENFLIKTAPKDMWEVRIDSILSAIKNVWNLSAIKMDSPSEVKHIIIEEYAFCANGRVFQLGELGGCIKYFCYKNGIKVAIIPIGQHKMYVARKGNAKKNEVIKMLRKRFNISVTNDNIADAISMALLYKARLDSLAGIPPKDPYDRALLARLETNINGREPKSTGKKRVPNRRSKKSNGESINELLKKSS